MDLPILQTTAVVAGSLLSCSAFSLSWFALPLIRDFVTPSTLSHTLRQFEAFSFYGDPYVPVTCIATTAISWATAYQKRGAGDQLWTSYALAGGATVCMIPFTIAFVLPINQKLYRLQSQVEKGEVDREKVAIKEMKKLLEKWNVRHLIRSFMPLVGAAIGAKALLQEFRVCTQ